MVERRRVCGLVESSIREVSRIILTRPMTPRMVVSALRTLDRLMDTYERIDCGLASAVVEKPVRDELCSRVRGIAEDVARASLEAGRIRDPDTFTSLVYYSMRVSDRLGCGRLFE